MCMSMVFTLFYNKGIKETLQKGYRVSGFKFDTYSILSVQLWGFLAMMTRAENKKLAPIVSVPKKPSTNEVDNKAYTMKIQDAPNITANHIPNLNKAFPEKKEPIVRLPYLLSIKNPMAM